MTFINKLDWGMATKIMNTSDHLMSARRLQKSRERGSAIVEYAFAVVMSLVLLFGMVDFGRALYSYHFISNAAREGTRYASVRGYTCSASAAPCPASSGDIQTFVHQTVPQGINPAAVTVTPNWFNPNGLPICNSALTRNYPGCAVRVKVDYNFNFLFPYNFPPFFQFPANTFTMSSTSQMIISR
jgi:Flp pilus assembly protein TadG